VSLGYVEKGSEEYFCQVLLLRCYLVSQVAERALFLWNSEALINGGVLSKDFASAVLTACRVRTIAGGVSLSLCDASVPKIFHV
jgi:hypothetical protein